MVENHAIQEESVWLDRN